MKNKKKKNREVFARIASMPTKKTISWSASFALQGRGIEKGEQGAGSRTFRDSRKRLEFVAPPFASLFVGEKEGQPTRTELAELPSLAREKQSSSPGPLLVFSLSSTGTTRAGQTTKDDGPCFLPSPLVITTDWQRPEGDLNVSCDLVVFDAPSSSSSSSSSSCSSHSYCFCFSWFPLFLSFSLDLSFLSISWFSSETRTIAVVLTALYFADIDRLYFRLYNWFV